MTRLFAQAAFDLRCWWRNGEQLLLLAILPITGLVLGDRFGARLDLAPNVLIDGTVALAFFATGFVGQGILTAFDRRGQALMVIGAGPLGRTGFVIARSIAVITTCAAQAVLFAVAAIVLGLDTERVAMSSVIALLGVPAFTALGLLMAGTLRAELVLAMSNIVLMFTAVFGGTFNEVEWTPVGAVRALQMGDISGLWYLMAWTFVAGITSIRQFRWTD